MPHYDRITTSVHGFRDWAEEETDHPLEDIEAALAHIINTEVGDSYARRGLSERRRRLMDDQ